METIGNPSRRTNLNPKSVKVQSLKMLDLKMGFPTLHLWILFLLIVAVISFPEAVRGQELVAYLSQEGLHGELHFHEYNDTHTLIKAQLETTLQYPDQVWSWSIREYPVDYTLIDGEERCRRVSDFSALVHNLVEPLGYLVLPDNSSAEWWTTIPLFGKQGLWGKSLLLIEVERHVQVCATITTIFTRTPEYLAEAKFHTPIAGSIYFRWMPTTANRTRNTLIYSDLYHVRSREGLTRSPTRHHWKLYVTDILKQNSRHHQRDDCNFLQLLFNPDDREKGKAIGDLDDRTGKLQISKDPFNHPTPLVYYDDQLDLSPSDLTIPHRTLYLMIFDDKHPERFLTCSRIRHLQPNIFKAIIEHDHHHHDHHHLQDNDIHGNVTFIQRSRFEPTFLNFSLEALNPLAGRRFAANVAKYAIHELPPMPQKRKDADYCLTTKNLYNPRRKQSENREEEAEEEEMNIRTKIIPPPGYGTQDQYPLGDLSGKLQNRNPNYPHNYQLPDGIGAELNGLYSDVFLPLQGTYSIMHRSLVIKHYNRTNPSSSSSSSSSNGNELQLLWNWCCVSLERYQNTINNHHYHHQHYQQINQYVNQQSNRKPIFSAEVLFRYPIVGRILFRQALDEPWLDTSILIEYLIHADGSVKENTGEHRWAIHSQPPGKDFYSWQKRCLSTGGIYNPYNIHRDNNESISENGCRIQQLASTCPVGALDIRHQLLNIAGGRVNGTHLTRQLYTDTNLPLSGQHSILGKSLVIYDDHGPVARGERLACSMIHGHYRRKMVARDWYGNDQPVKFNGKVEFHQQSEYETTSIETQFKGIPETANYNIHQAPIRANLAFPCEQLSVSGIYRKLFTNTNEQTTLGPGHWFLNTSSLVLFGAENIAGRSLVIRDRNSASSWICSNLERGYSASEAHEVNAIASFHHPQGFVYGYIKLSQLVYNDGSQSDTSIEINLSYPGKNDRNRTRNHHWEIFVNPVGVDAVVKFTNARCAAGGYVWNPYFTQLADPNNRDLYERECANDNPLRCFVGDVGRRLGPIEIGGERKVLIDSNFPLDGPVSAVGRSIVIFGPEFSGERFACANIEPNHDLFKYVNIQKPPRFVLDQFIEDLRGVMGIPEWMLEIDARKTKELHGGTCIQMIIYFKGPLAHKLEQDMSRLIASGRLEAPSLYIPGYMNKKRKTSLSYRKCGVRDINDKFLQKNGIYIRNDGAAPLLFVWSWFGLWTLIVVLLQ